MEQSRGEVRRLAQLARLELSADEVDLFARQLAEIVELMDQLPEAAADPPPAAAESPLERADEARHDPAAAAALANAPTAREDFFVVPAVLTPRRSETE